MCVCAYVYMCGVSSCAFPRKCHFLAVGRIDPRSLYDHAMSINRNQETRSDVRCFNENMKEY
jgi:hypothetical protein